MEKRFQQNRKTWFRIFKKLLVCRYKKPRFVYLGEEYRGNGIIISNHVGTDAPLTLELYCDKPIRMWGAHEMNSGLIKCYKYQTRIYYHQKKHWNLHLARLFCLIASPLTTLFYKGLRLISTYRDARFLRTLRESIAAIKAGENIVVFPEDSSMGYKDELEGFFCGFLVLAEHCRHEGLDLPIYVTYYRKRDITYFVDAPILYSELCKNGATKEEIAARLLARCNELGKMDPDALPTPAADVMCG